MPKGKRGWFRHPVEHGLAAKGIKTAAKPGPRHDIKLAKLVEEHPEYLDHLTDSGLELVKKGAQEAGKVWLLSIVEDMIKERAKKARHELTDEEYEAIGEEVFARAEDLLERIFEDKHVDKMIDQLDEIPYSPPGPFESWFDYFYEDMLEWAYDTQYVAMGYHTDRENDVESGITMALRELADLVGET